MKGVQLQGFEIDPLQVTLRTWDENLDYEDAFLKYSKAFDSSLTDEQLEECWSQAVSELEETPYNEDVYAIVMKGDETLIG